MPPNDSSDQRLGEYIIGPLLGKGGEGTVYLATTPRWPGHVFALKVISVPAGSTLDAYPEVLALQRLEHLHLMRCYAVQKLGCRLLLLFEHCAGGTLDDELATLAKPMSEERFVLLARQLISAVQYLHSAGFSHADIKPSNLFFRDAQRTVLALGDFGMIRSSEHTFPKAQGGSRYYQPPEFFASGAAVDPREADVWAVGVVLVWMLTGQPPWNGTSERQIVSEIRRCHYCLQTGTRPDIGALVHMLLCDRSTRARIHDIAALPLFASPRRPPHAPPHRAAPPHASPSSGLLPRAHASPSSGLLPQAHAAYIPRRKSIGDLGAHCGVLGGRGIARRIHPHTGSGNEA